MRRAMLLGTVVAGAVGVVGLSGCGALPAADPAVQGPMVVDQKRVATVEHLASRAGTRIVWVHPPTKRVP